jgi:LuxR family transcriptional regulator, maltose regulon positive regulatory protein
VAGRAKQGVRRTPKTGPPPPPAKITAPRLREVLKRERLLLLLDEASAQSSCVWIEGPPGAGKTTLVLHWLATRKRPCLWYQVDPGDHDLATLCHYLGQSAEETGGPASSPLPAFTPEYLGGIAVFTRRYFEVLSRRLPSDAVIVFDNLQEAGDGPLFEALRIAVEQLAPGQLVFCLSRIRPPATFARLRTHGQLAALGWEHFRLTTEEASGIARLRRVSAAVPIDELCEKAQGWMAGLLLLLEEPGAVGDRIEFDRRRAQVLFDYFAAEIFARLSEVTRLVLMKTAFLPEVSADAARRVSGVESAGRILEDLIERNYFIVERPGSDSRCEYHPLFRGFLLACAEKQLKSKELLHTKALAAELLASAGRYEDAASLFREIAAFAELAALIRDQAPQLVAQCRFATLREWLDALPKEARAEDPWLAYWQGVAHLFFDPEASEASFAAAYTLFQRTGDGRGVFLAWCGAVDAITWPQTHCERLALWTERLDHDMKRHGAALNDLDLEGRVAGSMLLGLYFGSFEQPLMNEWAARAARLWGRMTELTPRLQVGAALSHYYFQTGRETEAVAITKAQSRAIEQREDAGPGAVLQCRLAELLPASSGGRPERAVEVLNHARALAESTGIHVCDPMLFGVGIWGLLVIGDLRRADELLEQWGRVIARMPESLNVSLWHIGQSWRLRFDGQYAAAAHHAQEGVRISIRARARMPEAWGRYFLAQARLDEGNPEGAAREVEACLKVVNATGLQAIAIWVALLQARIAFVSGDEAAGVALLRDALKHAHAPSLYSFLVGWIPEHACLLYAKALEHGIHVEFVRQVIRRGNLAPPASAPPPSAWPLPVRIYTLGRFCVLIDDRPLTFRGKSQKRPLELLKALIAFGAHEVREDRLLEALWPEADGDAAALALSAALHRLRRLIGKSAILRKEGRLTLDARQCWVDVWPLERGLSALEARALEADSDESARRIRDVLSLYRGRFLDGDADSSWIVAARERLERRTSNLLGTLGDRHLAAERHAQAIAFFQLALEIEPLRETVYRGLISAHLARGERGEALAIYERCRHMLSAHFSCEPSADTEALVSGLGRAEWARPPSLGVRAT